MSKQYIIGENAKQKEKIQCTIPSGKIDIFCNHKINIKMLYI